MALGHWLKDYIGPHSGGSGGSGGGGIKPLIIHVTDEEVKDPQTQKLIGHKTDVLASDAYEAWQNGVSIYLDIGAKGEWLVLSVNKKYAIAGGQNNDSLTSNTLIKSFDDGYLFLEEYIDDDQPVG